MRKTKVRETVVALVVLAIALFFIAGTYARYSTSGAANGQVQVAKWAVAMTGTNNGSTVDLTQSTVQDITFTVQSNTNVVPGKIAPSVTATSVVELDLTGTEVAVDFEASVNNAALQSIGMNADQITLTVDGGSSTTIPLVNNSAFTAANGKRQVTLTLTWTNLEANNENDTTIGEAAPTITIPVTLVAKQHID